MRYLRIKRSDHCPGSEDEQTTGELTIHENANILLSAKTLELPWLENQKRISSIPKGLYIGKKRHTTKSKYNYEHIHILNVPNRSYILIHALNYVNQTNGCIGVGSKFSDINNDQICDIIDSKKTLAEILDLLPNEFLIEIS